MEKMPCIKQNRTLISSLLLATLLIINSSSGFAQDSTVVRNIRMDEIFQLAGEHSKVIQLTKAAISASIQKTETAKDAKLPDFGLDIQAAYMSNIKVWGLGNIPSGTYSAPNFFNNYSLDAAWVVYAGGNINRGIALSELGEKMAELDYQTSRMDICLMLAGYYLDMYVSQNQEQVLEKNIEQTNLLLKTMANRLEVGTILKSDYIRYELQLSNLQFALTQIRNRLNVLNQELVETLDLPGNTRLQAVEPENQEPKLSENPELTNNAEVAKASLQQEMAQQNVAIQKNDFLPNVALFANNSLTRPFMYDMPMVDMYSNIWMAGVSVSFNIEKLYKNKSKLNQAKVQYDQSNTALELAREKARIDMHKAVVDYNEAIEHLDVARKELELATENYDMIINQYKNELALITDVMDASSAKLNAELQLENARAAIRFAWFKIQRVTGNL